MLYAIPVLTGIMQRKLRGMCGSFLLRHNLEVVSGKGVKGLAVAANGASGGKEYVD